MPPCSGTVCLCGRENSTSLSDQPTKPSACTCLAPRSTASQPPITPSWSGLPISAVTKRHITQSRIDLLPYSLDTFTWASTLLCSRMTTSDTCYKVSNICMASPLGVKNFPSPSWCSPALSTCFTPYCSSPCARRLCSMVLSLLPTCASYAVPCSLG